VLDADLLLPDLFRDVHLVDAGVLDALTRSAGTTRFSITATSL
jgi:hypothetical protein